jgi:DNA polymerase-3 subunit epsilon
VAEDILQNKYINDVEFVVVDVETTGNSAQLGRITEIGMVKIVDGEIVDEYSSLINPELFIPNFITNITGITNEMVAQAPKFDEVKSRIKTFLGDAVFVAHNVQFDCGFLNASFIRSGLNQITNNLLCTVRLARRLLPTTKSKSLESLINYYGINVSDRHRALADAKATSEILIRFLEIMESRYDIETLTEIIGFQYKSVFKLKKPPKYFSQIKQNIENIPEVPGVYFMYDKHEDLIYVGKGKNLKERIESYFYHNTGHTPKVFEMVRKVQQIKYEVTNSELSALLRESELIKKFRPPYNRVSRRYRKYPFLKINLSEKYPILCWDYNITDDGSAYYGPFTNRYHVEIFLETLNRLFKLRECTNFAFARSTGCLYADINRCLAPCVTEDKEGYQNEINNLVCFLNGKMNNILDSFVNMMQEKANDLKFEEAAEIRDKITIIQKFIVKHQYLPYSIGDANFLLIVPCYRKSFELFFIRNSKLLKLALFEKFCRNKIIDILKSSYPSEDLFDGKYTKKDFHQFQIILSWVYKNINSVKIININDNPVENVLSEIEEYLS